MYSGDQVHYAKNFLPNKIDYDPNFQIINKFWGKNC